MAIDLDDVLGFTAPKTVKIRDRCLGISNYLVLCIGLLGGLGYSLGYKCIHLKEYDAANLIFRKTFEIRMVSRTMLVEGFMPMDLENMPSGGHVMAPEVFTVTTESLNESSVDSWPFHGEVVQQHTWSQEEKKQYVFEDFEDTTLSMELMGWKRPPTDVVYALGEGSRADDWGSNVWQLGSDRINQIGQKTWIEGMILNCSSGSVALPSFNLTNMSVHDLYILAHPSIRLVSNLILDIELTNAKAFDVFAKAAPTYRMRVIPDYPALYEGHMCQNHDRYNHVRQGAMVRTSRFTDGICFDLRVTGSIRAFDIMSFLSALVAYSFLIGASQSVIVLAAKHIMPERKRYKELLIEESVDFHHE